MMRHYKNYGNVRFIPLMNDIDHMFSVYIGNNGVGKSAILEAIDLVLNNQRAWNVTLGQKKTEAFICPLFLIPKKNIPSAKKTGIETVSRFFWDLEQENAAQSAREFIDYKNGLKKYEKTHYLILVGISNDEPGAYFSSSFDSSVRKLLGDEKEEQNKKANDIKELVLNQYTYMYIPVEESPSELLQLQNITMQKLLNVDIQKEIEKILGQKQENGSIVNQINKNLDVFINEVNKIISEIDPDYGFAASVGSKKNLTAKDVREKIIEAFFPLRSLKKGLRRVDLLSSGEQRRAVIDVAYSTLIANKDRKTERNIILAIDEPETSMHISNCFNQFLRLEELSRKGVQIVLTTHWYGYLPLAQHGMMHYLELIDGQTQISSFNLYNLLENRRRYPDDVELKSMFDLASSLIAYMRRGNETKWIFCEGSDDKIYLETMLGKYRNVHIIPVGGCGNVIKLYQIFVGFMSEKSEEASDSALFLIDTDEQLVHIREPFKYSSVNTPVALRRLQIVNGKINLLDPTGAGTYSQTEMEDCLNPQKYYEAVCEAIKNTKDRSLKATFGKYEFVSDAPRSVFRGDGACIRAKDANFISKKQQILDFVEDDINKKLIADIYAQICRGKNIDHPLADMIATQLGLEKK